MPDVEITIGDRKFFVTCRAGEEHFLNAAAKMLDAEATPLQAQMGRLPEARMLLMAGLMLADRTASLEDELRVTRAKLAEAQALAAAPAPVHPGTDLQTLATLAVEAEALAASIEERLS